ncbi:uncharacterized protein LOC8282356 isoform X1 [Ricinus communis]|uniref:uncharacterized protein LOC8282356 isoform X1 n=1 Tax=Ricinus communis TaxID=3988 RepID=UPI00201AD330|nr:uncharacterized protein LOC8282356 isoform X1 [Ricinus communis]
MIMRRIFGREQRKGNSDANHNNNNNNNTILKVIIERRCGLSPLSLKVDEDDAVNGNGGLVVRRYSYLKLPQQLLKLTVLKLDGSSFDVNIGRNATVAELKQAVEEIFSSSPEEGHDKISWSLVWGHFCLSYENQKLINDKVCIRNFGIKDGDQLQFIRHMSINYSNSRQSTSQNAVRKSLGPPSKDANVEKEQKTTEDHTSMNENQDYNLYDYCEDQEEIPISEFKLAHFLRGWLSYSRLWGTASRKGSQGQNRPSKFALECFGGRPRMIKLQS